MSRCQNRCVPTPDSIMSRVEGGTRGIFWPKWPQNPATQGVSYSYSLSNRITKINLILFGTNNFLSRLDESFRLSLFNGMVCTLGLEIRFGWYKLEV